MSMDDSYYYNLYIEEKLEQDWSYQQIRFFGCNTREEAQEELSAYALEHFSDVDITISQWEHYVLSFEKHNPRPLIIGGSTVGRPIRDPEQWRISPYDSSWQKLKKQFRIKNRMSEESIENIEVSAGKVLGHLALDSREEGYVKGLVYGSVQSGKTANMEALMSRAADADWNIFIILTGTIEKLRIQTRDRFKKDLCSTPAINWVHLDFSGDDKNFSASQLELNASNSAKYDNRYVITCLKQKSRIEKLIRWIYSDPGKTARMRVVIIDDEADQASVNTAPILDGEVDKEVEQERKTINRLITRLANGKTVSGETPRIPLQAINYISFTATPYANVLNEKPGESLYPKDFVHSLMDPREYFGCSAIFGNPDFRDEDDEPACPGLDIVRNIPREEVEALSNMHDEKDFAELTELEKSLSWFLCAAAALRIKGWRKPISMLVHTSGKTKDHFSDYALVRSFISERPHKEIIALCRDTYSKETSRFTYTDFAHDFSGYGRLEDVDKGYPAFEEIEPEILEITKEASFIELDAEGTITYSQGINLCVDNCKAKAGSNGIMMRILYPTDEILAGMEKAPVFIVMGGNTLSRGLTIEGLVCTYFTRASSQADTLMQMGRWFGYRIGYELLQRIWLTQDARNKYLALAKAEMNLKKEIRSFDEHGLRPSELGIKVSAMPEIARFMPTSKNKMQLASGCSFNFTGYSEELTHFDSSEETLRHNLAATEDFLLAIDTAHECIQPERTTAIWHNVPHEKIASFISSLILAEASPLRETMPNLLLWLSKSESFGPWNIAVNGKEAAPSGTWQLPSGRTLHRIERSRKKGDEGTIDIGSLRSGLDALCDVREENLTASERILFQDVRKKKKGIVAARAKLGLDKTPLLLLYRIDCKSNTASTKDNGRRTSLNCETDPIGFAVIIPGEKLAGGAESMLWIDLDKTGA